MKKLVLNNEEKIISKFDVITSILNIGAGKISPIDLGELLYPFLINLDRSYLLGEKIETIEAHHNCFNNPLKKPVDGSYSHYYRCKCDAYKFLETYYNKFDLITVYRFLEHVEYTKVPYFIYLLSQTLRKDGLLDIIVPDYYILAKMIIEDDPTLDGFEAKNILLTTELLNEPHDPHASIWTVERLLYYFGLEGRFDLEKMFGNFKFDGRDIYLRAIFRRV